MMFNFCLKEFIIIINNKKMAISAQEVNKLRQMTGSGMMDCKKALVKPMVILTKQLNF